MIDICDSFMSKPFRFKQFQIVQEKSAMKIGTDGVLLSAWADLDNANSILDIGTGTGVIAIMAAQKNKHAHITALEIDKNAFEEASYNASQCQWSNRMDIIHSSLQEYESIQQYDHIICNPPFFVESQLTNPKDSRSFARQEIALPLETLIKKVDQLLDPTGRFSMVYPIDRFEQLSQQFIDSGFHLSRQLITYGRPGIEAKRVFLEWKKVKSEFKKEELIIEEFGRHQYSKRFIELTREFYLNL